MTANPEAEQGNTAAETPAPARFVGGKPREEVVELDWPVEYDGKVYDRVTVRRISVEELRAFIESSADGASAARMPMFDVPMAVLDALDPDDDERVMKVMRDFLPRRLREAAEASPQAGGDTAPSSPPPSAGRTLA